MDNIPLLIYNGNNNKEFPSGVFDGITTKYIPWILFFMNYQWSIKNKKIIKNAIDNSVEKLTHHYLLM